MGLHKRKDGGMVKPKKAKGKRRKIGHDFKHGPGGPHTPGAKKNREKKRAAARKKSGTSKGR